MSVSYDQAPRYVHEMAQDILEHYHPELNFSRDPENPAWVRLCILMAAKGDDDGDEAAVKQNGYPAQALISVIPLKQRVDKRADAEIVIDEKNWEDLNEPQQRALLDHMIEHLEIKKKDGCVVTDDIGRPALKLRICDFRVQGFRAVARRHGANAPEVIAARHFEEDFGKDVLRADADTLPFHLTKENLEGPAREAFGEDLVSVEDGPHGPIVTTR